MPPAFLSFKSEFRQGKYFGTLQSWRGFPSLLDITRWPLRL
ncbi:hypothetical protein BC938DRAFT_473147 [Jimgerdemannia flammicorona]|uniref:Uncharacterized protein n=1 Tax=Jimgerdemannia flammicorona TaxID=994334 RepID=A0A433Q4P2_9FUNG|nr:hypothetical protein BC938DRAFT_473147 [Jimgerdemannia flammicorona]